MKWILLISMMIMTSCVTIGIFEPDLQSRIDQLESQIEEKVVILKQYQDKYEANRKLQNPHEAPGKRPLSVWEYQLVQPASLITARADVQKEINQLKTTLPDRTKELSEDDLFDWHIYDLYVLLDQKYALQMEQLSHGQTSS